MRTFFKFLSLPTTYRQEVDAEISKYIRGKLCPSHNIDSLPLVLRNYLKQCGFVMNEQLTHCSIKWKYAYLKMAPEKKWLPLKCDQVNFIPEPARLALMETKLFGLIPIGARDKFQAGKGNMLVKLLKLIPVSNANGRKIDTAELVTILAEAILVPAYFFQPYITWEEMDRYTVKGTIAYKDIKASGMLYFNEQNEFLRFETEDRYYNNNGKFEKYKWSAYAWNYKKMNGFSQPLNFMAVWNMPNMNYPYFKGRVDKIKYNYRADQGK
jgi:hypothetical protein